MKKVTLFVVGAAVLASAGFASAGESLFSRTKAPRMFRPRAFLAQNDPLTIPPAESPEPAGPTLYYQPDPAALPDATYGDPVAPSDTLADPTVPGATYGDPALQGQFADPTAPPMYGNPGLQPTPEWQGAPGAEMSPLYQNVKVEDPDNVAPCAVPQIVQVPLPCNRGCGPQTVSVQILVPNTCGPPRVKHSHFSNKVKYDYGRYEIEVKAEKDGVVKVDYDNSVLNLLN